MLEVAEVTLPQLNPPKLTVVQLKVLKLVYAGEPYRDLNGPKKGRVARLRVLEGLVSRGLLKRNASGMPFRLTRDGRAAMQAGDPSYLARHLKAIRARQRP
jgi:hypothetical protein